MNEKYGNDCAPEMAQCETGRGGLAGSMAISGRNMNQTRPPQKQSLLAEAAAHNYRMADELRQLNANVRDLLECIRGTLPEKCADGSGDACDTNGDTQRLAEAQAASQYRLHAVQESVSELRAALGY